MMQLYFRNKSKANACVISFTIYNVLNWSEINVLKKKDNFSKNKYMMEEVRDLRVPRLIEMLENISCRKKLSTVATGNDETFTGNLAKKNVNTTPGMARLHYSTITPNKIVTRWTNKIFVNKHTNVRVSTLARMRVKIYQIVWYDASAVEAWANRSTVVSRLFRERSIHHKDFFPLFFAVRRIPSRQKPSSTADWLISRLAS